ncbi:hypothetical protein PMAYCL1PPCAC_28543, partial [Pristionchus mayeri]
NQVDIPMTNSKGMPRDNQLFFIPWEIVDRQEMYRKHLNYVDLNMDDVPDCIQPKANTDIGRRTWTIEMNANLSEAKPDEHPRSQKRSKNYWRRDTTQKTDNFRVDTVPGFTGALVKKIINACAEIMEHELAHSERGEHLFTDDLLLLVYRHVLLQALRNPFLLIFNEEEWEATTQGFNDPKKPVMFTDFEKMIGLSSVGSSISFLFGAHEKIHNTNQTLKLPDTLA